MPKSLYPLLSENQLSIVRGGADNTAVVSLDKTDMVVNMEDHTLLGSSGETVFVTDLSVATTLNLRVYWPNKIEPSSEMVTDTLYWQSFGYTPDDAHSSLPLTAEFIQEAMRQISARVRELFIPHVDNVNRYIYTSTNPAMDDAYDFGSRKNIKRLLICGNMFMKNRKMKLPGLWQQPIWLCIMSCSIIIKSLLNG